MCIFNIMEFKYSVVSVQANSSLLMEFPVLHAQPSCSLSFLEYSQYLIPFNKSPLKYDGNGKKTLFLEVEVSHMNYEFETSVFLLLVTVSCTRYYAKNARF
jgi:hypothetical protein